MLVTTLDRMARGGIQDHLAGGFHRYSTDALWLVPHFEKMLYDNAALARLYAEADALVPGRGFAAVARATLDFVLAEMTGPDGELHSAIDAETDGHEGAYYTWTAEELRAALSPDDHALLGRVYGFDGRPNFESTRYVLASAGAARGGGGGRLGVAEDELRRRLEPGRRALLAVRGRRPRPLLDDKVLADWNGLMIGAFARASVVLGEPRYLVAARRAAEFVLSRLASEGRLLHAWRSGRARIPAFLDDYAFLVEGLLRLFEATGEERWKQEALRLQAEQDERLLDASAGGYFAAGEDPRLLFRAKPAFDGALASGNGFAALNLLELAALSGDPALRDSRGGRARGLLRRDRRRAPRPRDARARRAQLGRSAVAAAPVSSGRAGPARPQLSLPLPLRLASPWRTRRARSWKVVGRLGSGLGEEWKPFTVELKVAKGWHLYANAAGHPFRRLHVDGAGARSAARPAVSGRRAVRLGCGARLRLPRARAARGRDRAQGRRSAVARADLPGLRREPLSPPDHAPRAITIAAVRTPPPEGRHPLRPAVP